MPPANDDLSNAQVIAPSHISTLSGTTVDATSETDETNQGYDQPSVWYVIAALSDPTQGSPGFAPGKLRVHFTASDYPVYGELYSGPPGATSYLDLTFEGSFDAPPDYTEFELLDGVTYYIYVGNEAFDFSEGTFDLETRFTYSVVPAVDDPASATTSVLADGVRDAQVLGGTYASAVSLAPSVLLAAADEIPSIAGRWQVRTWMRENDPTPSGFPQTGLYWHLRVNDVFAWSDLNAGNIFIGSGVTTPVQQDVYVGEDEVVAGGGYGFGGWVPWVGIKPGDAITIAMGREPIGDATSVDCTRVDYFLDAVASVGLRTGGWHLAGGNRHNGIGEGAWVTGDTHRLARDQDGNLYLIALVVRTPYETSVAQRGVWKLTKVSAERYDPDDNPLGFDSDDLGLWIGDTSDEDGTGLAVCVLDNGNIVASWIERRHVGSGTHSVYRFHGPAVWEWDGASWTSLTDCLSQWGNDTDYVRGGLDMATDGSDVFVAYYEWHDVFGAQTTGYFSDNFRWHCHKWDGASWTELGTGQQADTTRTEEPNLFAEGKGIAVAINPATGHPWVCWYEEDDENTQYRHQVYCYRWDGSAWVDTSLPQPSFGTGPYIGNLIGEERGIDIVFDASGDAVVVYAIQDLVTPFEWRLVLTRHDGTSWSTPVDALYSEWLVPNQPDFSYGSSIGTVMLELAPTGRVMLFATSTSHGSHDAATLDDDGLGFTSLSRLPFFNASMQGIFELYPLSGFVPTDEGRAAVAGTVQDNFESIMVAINEVAAGGVVSMNWRSADRGAGARRVLVGS